MSFNNKPDESFELKVIRPANVTASILIPWNTPKAALSLDKKPLKIKRSGNFILLENVGSGKHTIICTKQ